MNHCFRRGVLFGRGWGNKPSTGKCGDTSLEKSLACLPRVLSNALHPMLGGYGLFKGVMFHAAIEGLLQYKEKTEKYPNGFE